MKTAQLKNNLRDAIGAACKAGMNELDAINAALEVAEEWEMRRDELEDEEAGG